MKNHPVQPAPINPHTQRGAVLVVAMLLLLVMTVLGVSGAGNSLLEERMSNNFHESYSAMQSAETALRVAENWLTEEVKAGAVQFVPTTDASYLASQDWFGTDSTKKGLYSTQAAPGISTLCQGKTASECTFNAIDETHWRLNSDTQPKGYATLGSDDLGTGELPSINNSNNSLISQPPRFIIEYLGRGLGPAPSIVMGSSSATADARMYAFRITAIGWGGEATSRYVLQSHFQLQL